MYLHLINLIGPYMNREINRLFTGQGPQTHIRLPFRKKKKAYISNEQGTMIILSDKVYQL